MDTTLQNYLEKNGYIQTKSSDIPTGVVNVVIIIPVARQVENILAIELLNVQMGPLGNTIKRTKDQVNMIFLSSSQSRIAPLDNIEKGTVSRLLGRDADSIELTTYGIEKLFYRRPK